jgi:hypothetical protein
MTETLQAAEARTACIIAIQLVDGDRIHARIPGGMDVARAELAGIHGRLGSHGFVLIGEDTIVRSEDVRYVQARDEDDDESGAFLDTVRTKLGGGNDMSTHETQQRQRTQTREDGGPGIDQWVGYGNRPWAETKPFFFASEFWAAVLLVAGILIAAAMNDNFDAPRAWLYASIVGAAYVVSRGLAKSGTRDPNPDRTTGWR